jgi:hypothetical protein
MYKHMPRGFIVKHSESTSFSDWETKFYTWDCGVALSLCFLIYHLYVGLYITTEFAVNEINAR